MNILLNINSDLTADTIKNLLKIYENIGRIFFEAKHIDEKGFHGCDLFFYVNTAENSLTNNIPSRVGLDERITAAKEIVALGKTIVADDKKMTPWEEISPKIDKLLTLGLRFLGVKE